MKNGVEYTMHSAELFFSGLSSDAVAGLMGAVIGVVGTLGATWMAFWLQKCGKISMHVRLVHSKGNVNLPWGFYLSERRTQLYMSVPIWLDVSNTSGVSRIIRDFNLEAYCQGEFVAEFTQLQCVCEGDTKIPLGQNEAYTLVIEGNNAKRYNMQFLLYQRDITKENKAIDELRFRYFDENDKVQEFFFTKLDKCWIQGPLPTNKEWVAL